jgi:hypothetical protein
MLRSSKVIREVEWQEKLDYKFLVDKGFVPDELPKIAAMLRPEIPETRFFNQTDIQKYFLKVIAVFIFF